MRIIIPAIMVIFLSAAVCHADFYQWVDRSGVLHIADDLHKVPEEYRDRVKVFRTEARPEKKRGIEPTPPAPVTEPKKELYGDRPLEWWVETFRQKTKEISELEKTYNNKKRYVEIFESGRRFGGVIYGDKEIELYNAYKKDLPELEKAINERKDELEELRRKATIYGVPRDVREMVVED